MNLTFHLSFHGVPILHAVYAPAGTQELTKFEIHADKISEIEK